MPLHCVAVRSQAKPTSQLSEIAQQRATPMSHHCAAAPKAYNAHATSMRGGSKATNAFVTPPVTTQKRVTPMTLNFVAAQECATPHVTSSHGCPEASNPCVTSLVLNLRGANTNVTSQYGGTVTSGRRKTKMPLSTPTNMHGQTP